MERKTGRIRPVIKIFLAITVLIMQFPPTGYTASQTNVEIAMRHYNDGRYKEAMLTFGRTPKRELGEQAYVIWGLSAYRLGKFRSALLKFEQAYIRNPSNGDILNLMGDTHLKLGEPSKALHILRKTEGLKTSNPGATLVLWGYSANMSGNHKEAMRVFNKALKTYPVTEVTARVGISRSALAMKQFKKAETQARLALKKQPQNAEALGTLGEVLLKTKRYKEAAKTLRNATAYAPESILYYYNLACAMSRLERAEDACKFLTKSIQLGFKNIKEALLDEDLATARKSACFNMAIKKERP